MSSNPVDRVPEYREIDGIGTTGTVERPDRRRRTRLQVRWPLRFLQPGTIDVVETVTHDLSSDGFYCHAPNTFVPGEIRECTLGVPTHHPGDGDRVLPVQCRVRVIRVEALGENGVYGVGCRIEDYRFNGDATMSIEPFGAQYID